MKKTISVIISLLLFIPLLSSGVRVNALYEDGYTYIVRGVEATVTSASTKLSGEIEVPKTLDGYLVVGIGTCAFSGCTEITKITLPKDCVSLASNAFVGCTSLKTVEAKGKLSYVHPLAFNNTPIFGPDGDWQDGVLYFDNFILATRSNLRNVVIRSGVEVIPQSAFASNTTLLSVTIPDSVTTIEDYAFGRCSNLSDITLGNGVTHIGRNAFHGTAYFSNERNWHDDLLYLDYCLLSAKASLKGKVNIRSGTRVIASQAFSEYNEACDKITSISFPEGLITIGDHAFSNCDGLERITLPESLKTVEERAFAYCDSLLTVTVKGKNTLFESKAFTMCNNLELVRGPKGAAAESLGIRYKPFGLKDSFGASALAVQRFVTDSSTVNVYVVAVTLYAAVMTVLFILTKTRQKRAEKPKSGGGEEEA